MTTLQEQAEALAKKAHSRAYSRGVRFNSYEKDDEILTEEITKAILDFAQQERERCAEILCMGCRQRLPLKKGWHMDKNGNDTLIDNCCRAEVLRN